jgi:hypothetical protein
MDEMINRETVYQLGGDFLKRAYVINGDFDSIYLEIAGEKKPLELPLKYAGLFVEELDHIVKTVSMDKARYETELLRIANKDIRDSAKEKYRKGRKK